MDIQSPLTQQARPNTFIPKVVELYNDLFHDEHVDISEGFWREFFLLRPESSSLRTILNKLNPDELVHDHYIASQQLFLRAYKHITEARPPSDTIALDTLTVFLECVLNKKFTSPSADTITVLAGLDDVDIVLTEFVTAVDGALQDKRPLDIRYKTVSMAISAVSGAYRTGLVSYFINRDLFPSLMRVIKATDDPSARTFPLYLLTLLVNYNKFEFQNPYKLRIEDFIDNSTINTILGSIAATCALCRDQYATVQEDIPDGWNIGGALQWFGLGNLSRMPQTGAVTEEAANIVFSALPSSDAAILLSTYDFAASNKIFRLAFVTTAAEHKHDNFAFGEFLSLSSYIFEHASRSSSASLYACLNLLTLHTLLSDHEIAARMCSGENLAPVKLCRQRQPVLPAVKGDRILAAVVLDVVVMGIEHNISTQLDVDLYRLLLSVLLRLLSTIAATRTRLIYHWSSLWHALQYLVYHLDLQSSTLSYQPYTSSIVSTLAQILAFAIASGENILPDSASYDDLFSQLYLTYAALPKIRDAYSLTSSPALDGLIKMTTHCKNVLEEQEQKGKKVAPKDVGKLLRQGYERSDLRLDSLDLEQGPFREADWRALFKKIVREVVEDSKELIARRL